MTKFAESTIEEAAIDWLKDLGYTYTFGPEIAFDGEAPEHVNYQETLLLNRLPRCYHLYQSYCSGIGTGRSFTENHASRQTDTPA